MNNERKNVRIIGVGSSNVDLTGFAERLPAAGETVLGSELRIGPGGKGLNQITAAKRSGGDVVFITRIGRDALSATLRAHFAQESIGTDYVYSGENDATGCALIEIDGRTGQNRIVVIPGANRSLSRGDVFAAESAFAGAGAVMAQLEIPLETVAAAGELARANGIPFILNPAPYRPLDDGFLRGIDWLTPNETEAGQLTGLDVNTLDDARAAAGKLIDKGVRNVVITLGKNGAYWTDGQDRAHIPGIPMSAVDTTGAGDTFNGALAVALAEGKTPVDAIRFANAAAAISVTRKGAASSAPARDEINALAKKEYAL